MGSAYGLSWACCSTDPITMTCDASDLKTKGNVMRDRESLWNACHKGGSTDGRCYWGGVGVYRIVID